MDTAAGVLLDVILGRSAAASLAARTGRGVARQGGHRVHRPPRAYRLGLSPDLDHATVVADPFHIVALANRSLDKVRRRIQRDLTGHRGRKGDPLYDIRRVLLTGAERLTERGWDRLRQALGCGDPRDEALATWLAN